jgi:hypothetical protein
VLLRRERRGSSDHNGVVPPGDGRPAAAARQGLVENVVHRLAANRCSIVVAAMWSEDLHDRRLAVRVMKKGGICLFVEGST